MNIKQIQFKHFRNYDNLTLDFDKKVNIFIGDNAQGKTNIIEGIYLLAIARSHRTYDDSLLIQKNQDFTKVKGLIRRKGKANYDELEVLISSKGKRVSLNHNPIKRVSDYISNLNVIIFHPDDLDILKGSPGERRRFLNIEIGQLDNRYLTILNNYNNILKNRNEYLKRITITNYDEKYMDILTEQLVDNAIKIYKYREDFILNINDELKKVNERIKGLDSIMLKYETSIPLGNINELKDQLIKKYKSSLQREIIMAQTMIGPHRDDFVFFVNGRNIREFGSQGQQRMAVLFLKLAEIELFKNRMDEYPILLLDDIFSELDDDKRKSIIKYLDRRMQIMITTTNISIIEKRLLSNADIFKVSNGNVEKACNNKGKQR